MIAAVEDLKDIVVNWELLDVKEKSVRRVKVVNAEFKDLLDLKANRYSVFLFGFYLIKTNFYVTLGTTRTDGPKRK